MHPRAKAFMDPASRNPHAASRKEHADASHLTRKDGVFYYRRALPEHIEGTEVALSLGTRHREAEYLAEHLVDRR